MGSCKKQTQNTAQRKSLSVWFFFLYSCARSLGWRAVHVHRFHLFAIRSVGSSFACAVRLWSLFVFAKCDICAAVRAPRLWRSSNICGLEKEEALIGSFCWWMLGYVPGGAPFSQLSSGVKDTMAVSTEWWFTSLKCEAKTCKKGQVYNKTIPNIQ